MDFYKELEHALQTHNVEEKETIVSRALAYCSQNEINAPTDFAPVALQIPSYASVCRIVAPRDLPKRRALTTPEGLAVQIHAIAHIEYSAIDLAIDAAYRFVETPRAYTYDWLEVAADEIRHFKMLHELLEKLGYRYGDFPVHSGLFETARTTQHSLLERMAVVPRYFEAGGLDVNPQITAKLRSKRTQPIVEPLLDALDIIYDEEIEHVRKGDRWFKYACEKEGADPSIYFDILERHGLLGKRQGPLNVKARKAAGFACEEILKLGAKECEE